MKVIINAYDLGKVARANRAIKQALQDGYISSIRNLALQAKINRFEIISFNEI